MQNNLSREIALAGMFIAIGVLLPLFFHKIGAGPMFLPMHIPVLIAGFALSMPFSIIVGAATPVLSSLISGMPPMFPVLPYMVFELTAYSLSACVFYRTIKAGIYISLLASMIIGRTVSGIVVWLLASFLGAALPGPVAFVCAGAIASLPGIIIQLAIIPLVIFRLEQNALI